MKKIEQAGVNEEFITFIKAYLAERSAIVVVNGKSSSNMRLSNMISQGTVLGPLLWNELFKDLDDGVEDESASINKFADDLNIQKTYKLHIDNDTVKNDVTTLQNSVHEWGAVNRVHRSSQICFCYFASDIWNGQCVSVIRSDCRLQIDND